MQQAIDAPGKLLLLVEDNPDNVTLVRRALARAGVGAELQVAGSDTEAREFLYGLGEHAGRDLERVPDLVILDVNLPGMSGLDFLRLLRIGARTKRVPIVIFTSSSQPRDIERAYERGATSYVTKPIEFDRFAETVAGVARYWLTLNVPPPPAPAE